MFYFGQVFVFCRLIIKKKCMGWFLLIMCKEHTLTRSANLLSRNHPTVTLELCFWTGHFQNHPDSVISQKYQSLSNQIIKRNSAHVRSLNLTLCSLLNLGFVCSSLEVTTQTLVVSDSLFIISYKNI